MRTLHCDDNDRKGMSHDKTHDTEKSDSIAVD